MCRASKDSNRKHKGKADRCLVRLSRGGQAGLHLTQKTGVYSHFLSFFFFLKSVSTCFFNELLAKIL